MNSKKVPATRFNAVGKDVEEVEFNAMIYGPGSDVFIHITGDKLTKSFYLTWDAWKELTS